jgi:hypothetical protein
LKLEFIDVHGQPSARKVVFKKTPDRKKLHFTDIDTAAVFYANKLNVGRMATFLTIGGDFIDGSTVWSVRLNDATVLVKGAEVFLLKISEVEEALSHLAEIFSGDVREGQTLRGSKTSPQIKM